MEISKVSKNNERVFKNKSFFYSRETTNKIRDAFFPLPWKIWPYEGKIMTILIGIWSVLGLFILASASWWVASKEMGDWAYYLKRQIIWCIPGLSIFYFVLNTNIRDLLKISKIIFYLQIFLIMLTIFKVDSLSIPSGALCSNQSSTPNSKTGFQASF